MRPGANAPTHARKRRPTLTSGRFIDYGDRVVLADFSGNTWAAESVSIVQGGFGYRDDGVTKPPRPWTFDAKTGLATIEGDVVLIQFVNDNPATPIVMGGVRSAKTSEFLERNHGDGTKPFNRLAMRLRALDTTGAVVGEARADIHGDLGPGTLRALTTHTLELVLAPDLTTEAGALTLRLEGGVVTVTASGVPVPVLLATPFGTDASAAWTEVSTALAALGFPVVNIATHLAALASGGYAAQRLRAE